MTWRRIAAAAFVIASTLSGAFAQEFEFPANQFGKLNLRPNQSLGGNDDFIQAQQNGVFEPISEFNADDIFREWSRPVGRLSMLLRNGAGEEGVATCTATLIADDRILTNYHCIPGFDRNVEVVGAVVHFAYLRQDQAEENAYRVRIPPLESDPDLDFSVLQVDGQPGQVFGHVDIDPARVAPNTSLYIFHHPAGLPLRLTRFRCKAYSGDAYAGAEFRHRCDTLGGSSGSLIFDIDRRVVALHHSGGLNASSRSSFNSGTAIDAILQRSEIVTRRGAAPAGGSAAIAALPGAEPNIGSAPPVTGVPSVPAQDPAQTGAPVKLPPLPAYDLVQIRPGIAGGFMNVRAGPGVGHAIVGKIPSGMTGVRIYTETCRSSDDGKTRDPWCRGLWNTVAGWISSSGFVGGIPGSAAAEPSGETLATVRIRSTVSGGYMNVRSGPGLGHGVVGTIPAGTPDVRVDRQSCRASDDGRTSKPWCRVEWSGVSGWVSSGGFDG